jgi:hypothetical protein
MEPRSAAEHLQVIRTLMERSALYRRALAPIMIFAGAMGIAAAAAGIVLKMESQRGFVSYWISVAFIGVVGAFLLVRRQALKSAEPFWSPPTRRVALALAPALTAGLLLAIWVLAVCWQQPVADPPAGTYDDAGQLSWLPPVWAVFYGCALHAAGFFTSRGLRLFGWVFIAAGNAILLWLLVLSRAEFADFSWQRSHWLMGILFGVLQVAYGVYLFMTGEERNEP